MTDSVALLELLDRFQDAGAVTTTALPALATMRVADSTALLELLDRLPGRWGRHDDGAARPTLATMRVADSTALLELL